MTQIPPKRRPTITDVAALAGVSKGAVSRTFNSGERISPATTARIKAAAAQLGWVPSAAARAINGAPAQAIGVVLRRPAELLELDPFFSAFLAGVEAVLAQHRYSAILRFVDNAKDERECYELMAAEGRVDGFLISDLRQPDSRFRLLKDLDVPAVVVGRPGPSCPFPSVDSDSDDQVRQLIERFISAGHRRIAHVMGSPELVHAKSREALWRGTLTERGLQPGPVCVGNFTAAGGAEATRQLLGFSPRPTAIFYGNDLMAVAGMAVLADCGLRIPDDMAVAGFDDISIASYTSPTLSTVHCDYRGLGRAAADVLLTSIAGGNPPRRLAIASEVRIRASSGTPQLAPTEL